MTTQVTFRKHQVEHQQKKFCCNCNKRFKTKTYKSYFTMNPFNRERSWEQLYDEVFKDLQKEAKDDNWICPNCKKLENLK